MAKLIAILNVVAWSGFWAFGYLALTAESSVTLAVIFAALGGGVGLWCWFWLVRHSEAVGYAPAPKRGAATDEDEVAG
jgi:hypothetical protein